MIKNTLVFIVLIIFMSTLAGCNSKIPSDYPEETFPIYENAYIKNAIKNENGNFIVEGFSNDSVKKIADYYKDLVRNANAKIHSTKDVPNNFLEVGKLGDYTFTIVVINAKDESGYKTYFNIGLVPDN